MNLFYKKFKLKISNLNVICKKNSFGTIGDRNHLKNESIHIRIPDIIILFVIHLLKYGTNEMSRIRAIDSNIPFKIKIQVKLVNLILRT